MELVQSFKYKSFKAETFYKGNEVLPVHIYIDGKLVYETTIKPPHHMNIDDINVMVDVLVFMTVQKGDTDESYFENRPTLLNDWADNHFDCDYIKSMIYDFENGDDLPKKERNRIKKYIKNHL